MADRIHSTMILFNKFIQFKIKAFLFPPSVLSFAFLLVSNRGINKPLALSGKSSSAYSMNTQIQF